MKAWARLTGKLPAVPDVGYWPQPFQQDLPGDRLVKLLARADLQRSVVRVEVDSIDVRSQSIRQLSSSQIVNDPCPNCPAGVQLVAQATKSITQPMALVLPGVSLQRGLEAARGSKQIYDLPCALESGVSVMIGRIDEHLANALSLAHRPLGASSARRRIPGLKTSSGDRAIELVMAGTSAALEEVAEY